MAHMGWTYELGSGGEVLGGCTSSFEPELIAMDKGTAMLEAIIMDIAGQGMGKIVGLQA